MIQKNKELPNELHEIYCQKVRDILLAFVVDFSKIEEDFDPKKISLKQITDFISEWVDKHFNKKDE